MARTGGADRPGVHLGSGLQLGRVEAQWCGQPWSGLSLDAGETEAAGTGAGQSKSRSLARTTVDCCCYRWTCWRLTSPGGGRTPAPHSSSSWWTGGPCLCYCEKMDDKALRHYHEEDVEVSTDNTLYTRKQNVPLIK